MPTVSFTTLKGHPMKGRCAVASRDLTVGDCISLTSPFASSLHRSQKTRRCSRCFKPFSSPSTQRLKCTGCPANGETYYCGRICQVADFVTHRYECKKKGPRALQAAVEKFVLTHGENGENFPLDDYWLLRKVYYMAVFMAKSDGGEMKGLVPKLPKKLEVLSEHECAEDRVLADSVAASVAALEKNVEESDVTNLEEFFVRLLSKFRANNFGVLSDLQNVVGGAVFEKGAILNHSCSPNCVLVYERPEEEGEEMMQKIIVISDVKEGEELCHSYVELCQPTAERKRHLKVSYGFECSCRRCVEDPDKLDNRYCEVVKNGYKEEGVKSRVEEALASAEELMYGDEQEGEEGEASEKKEYDLIMQALSLQREYLGELNLKRYKSEALALSQSMLLSSVPSAIDHCQRVCDFLNGTLPKYHPLLVLQMMTLGELIQEGGERDEDATAIFQEVVPKLKVLYGEKHEYVVRVEENLKFLLKD
ncbi:hypothetical protein TrST_g7484 [Triparma strigata]|uniref:SET domain-containing protein n=1 Tax=Triparma strigata TaxID=1606541 RepID=A0A9W7A6Q1_9STRA|nr:hypothetical protein TrST_g7484 [Triparma strigata]